MTVLVVALTVAVALLGLLVVGLLRSHAEILRQLHALGSGREDVDAPAAAAADKAPFEVREGVVVPGDATGTPAHDLVGVSEDETSLVSVVGVPHDTLIAFLSTGCSTCEGFWEVFAAPGGTGLPDGTRLVVVTKGPDLESESVVRSLAPATVPLVMSTKAWEDYAVPGSPYFVLVSGRTGRVVGEGSASAWHQVVRLVGEAGTDLDLAARRAAGEDRGDGAHREERANRELLSAGIGPGHPSLFVTAQDAVVDLSDDADAPVRR